MNEYDPIEEGPPLEEIPSEVEDRESEPAGFEIVTYPTDFTLEGLVTKYKRGAILVPGFQRKFVWTIKQASRLIESFLLGLPVPAIFLYTDAKNENKQLVVDGQQRLMSIVYFFDGYFGEESKGRRTVFDLKGLNEESPYSKKTYNKLKEIDEAAYNKLNDAVLRAFVIKQLNPRTDSSVYPIFERLNTGGTQLVGQEIRNCIYHGPLNDLLNEMNGYDNWRQLFGKSGEDKRQRDVELILRFLALYHNADTYTKPMKTFLSEFMDNNRKPSDDRLREMKRLFETTMDAVLDKLGTKPFHIKAGLNAAAFDSVAVGFAKHADNIPDDIAGRYRSLLENEDFINSISTATTDTLVVAQRMSVARRKLFG